MPVDEASYRAWQGSARATGWVVFAIAGTMIRRLMRWRLVRYITWIGPLGACFISAVLFGLVREGKTNLPVVIAMQRSGMSFDDLLPLLNLEFQRAIAFWTVLLAALVGGPLIAEDRRAHALPLYFSRPLSHLDYVLGKFLAFAFFLSLLVLAPPICMYLIDVGFSETDGALLDRFPVLLWSLVPGLVRIAVLGSIALGISSLARKTNYAALLFLGIMMVVGIMGELLAREIFRDPSWRAVSPNACVSRIAVQVLPLPEVMPQRRSSLIAEMNVGAAWLGVGLWTAAGLAVLVARIRKVEVVT
ncbi:MAG: ABC transporter permease [Planctomycetota bacterium]|jgi:ABC-type transport system involved in multi-copper enzyme maturation permease subunit